MYPWLVALHLLGLVVFLLAHGVSMWVAFRIRGERERDVVVAMLEPRSRGHDRRPATARSTPLTRRSTSSFP